MFCPYTTLFFFFFITSRVHKPHLKIQGFRQAVKHNSVCGQDERQELRVEFNTPECKEGFLK